MLDLAIGLGLGMLGSMIFGGNRRASSSPAITYAPAPDMSAIEAQRTALQGMQLSLERQQGEFNQAQQAIISQMSAYNAELAARPAPEVEIPPPPTVMIGGAGTAQDVPQMPDGSLPEDAPPEGTKRKRGRSALRIDRAQLPADAAGLNIPRG